MGLLKEEFNDQIFYIIFERTEKKNALNRNLIKAIIDALSHAEERAAKIIVIRGSGGSFSSGGDIGEFYEADDPSSRIDEMAKMLNEVIRKIRFIPSIVISIIEGIATGAGLSLALACDLTMASENTILNMAYRKIGLTPDGGGSIFIPRIIGDKRFNALYLLSKDITAEEAQKAGLINFVFKAEELDQMLQRIVKELLSLPLEVIPYYKNLVNTSIFSGFENHLERERLFVSELAGKSTFKEKLESFFRRKKNA